MSLGTPRASAAVPPLLHPMKRKGIRFPHTPSENETEARVRPLCWLWPHLESCLHSTLVYLHLPHLLWGTFLTFPMSGRHLCNSQFSPREVETITAWLCPRSTQASQEGSARTQSYASRKDPLRLPFRLQHASQTLWGCIVTLRALCPTLSAALHWCPWRLRVPGVDKPHSPHIHFSAPLVRIEPRLPC